MTFRKDKSIISIPSTIGESYEESSQEVKNDAVIKITIWTDFLKNWFLNFFIIVSLKWISSID